MISLNRGATRHHYEIEPIERLLPQAKTFSD
jgi:hypothetical protein